MARDVDRLFDDEPTPPDMKPVPPPAPRSGIPEDPPELTARLMRPGESYADFFGLERRIELLANETRDGFKLIGEKILPVVTQIADEQRKAARADAETRKEMSELRRAVVAIADQQNEITDRLDAQDRRQNSLEQRVAALESVPMPVSKRPMKRAGRKPRK